MKTDRSIMVRLYLLAAVIILVIHVAAVPLYATSSANIPLDSPIYSYLDKLAGFGLVTSDIKGIKPFSKAEAARLLLEAERNLASSESSQNILARELLKRGRELLPREVYLLENPDKKAVLFDYNPLASVRFSNVWLDGVPRDYRRDVHDPGNDGVFGIGSGLRPKNPYPSPVQQHGSEGTPLFENNDGVTHRDGYSAELRWGSEWYWSDKVTALLEPSLLANSDDTRLRLNRGYLKLGGKSLELEVGKDENWLGPGYRGTITLTNNAVNLTQVKLSSPEPLELPYVGALKYAVIGSRFDRTTVGGVEMQPWFCAVKLSAKPAAHLEVGLNMGRQVGGPGVSGSTKDLLQGWLGGAGTNNANSLAGFDVRYRLPWLRNSELYGEFSGEDTALFWPIVESYVAGLYIPRLTDDGRNDFRFEFFQGNQILYTHGIFQNGYVYKDMPLGHSQGGATQDFFFRGSHWFTPRNNLALEYIYTNRGMVGRLAGQSVEKKHAGRVFWSLPLYGELDGQLGYGIERVSNLNLVNGVERTNQLLRFEMRYRY